jgi:hypothetical protein
MNRLAHAGRRQGAAGGRGGSGQCPRDGRNEGGVVVVASCCDRDRRRTRPTRWPPYREVGCHSANEQYYH